MRIVLGLMFSIVMLFGADATIEVTKKVDSLPSIAIEDASVNYTDKISKQFFRVLQSDMNVLAIFNVDRNYASTHFNNEKVTAQNSKVDYVLRYRLSQDDNGAFVADIKLIHDDSPVMQKRYRVGNSNMHVFIAHAIAYDINEQMGAVPVEWIKRKVVISRLVAPGKSEILITDYTLSYQHVMIRGGLKVFPQWADEEQTKFYYSSLDERLPTLYLMDTRTGKSQKIMSSDGMMVCSDVSEDGRQLLLTMAPSGQPDIYLYDTVTKQKKRMTTYSGIDVSGQFMEDGRITFVSNRLGYPNIFSKKINSKAVEQMVYYGKSNSSCSAHKEYLVYKARESNNAFSPNTFNLHLISTKTDFIRRLTATGINEFPRFSKDGSSILFVKNYKKQSSIGIIRLEYNKNFLFPLKVGKIQSMDW